MSWDPIQFEITQLARVVESMGWSVMVQDTETEFAIVTIQKLKATITDKWSAMVFKG